MELLAVRLCGVKFLTARLLAKLRGLKLAATTAVTGLFSTVCYRFFMRPGFIIVFYSRQIALK
jgi:hypothetical protein